MKLGIRILEATSTDYDEAINFLNENLQKFKKSFLPADRESIVPFWYEKRKSFQAGCFPFRNIFVSGFDVAVRSMYYSPSADYLKDEGIMDLIDDAINESNPFVDSRVATGPSLFERTDVRGRKEIDFYQFSDAAMNFHFIPQVTFNVEDEAELKTVMSAFRNSFISEYVSTGFTLKYGVWMPISAIDKNDLITNISEHERRVLRN